MKPATSGGCAAVSLSHTKVEAETQMCLGRQRQSIGWRAVYQTERVEAHSSHLAHMHVGVFRGNQNHSDCSWVPA